MNSRTIGSVHYLSFDVEDWFHVSFLRPYLSPEHWGKQTSVVEAGTRAILDMLAAHGVQATFFVLGAVAEKHPQLVCDILVAGHEVATHGSDHEIVEMMTPKTFAEDVRRSMAIIEDITKIRPLGYRAPLGSISERSLWALDILRDEGLRYDSSVYPSNLLVWAGIKRIPPTPFEIVKGLWEVPLSVEKFLGLSVPLSGGFYLRAFPFCFFEHLLRRRDRRGDGAVLYYHPWEFATGYPRLITHPAKRFVQYHSLNSVGWKLKRLLATFRFRPLREAVLV